MRVHWGHADSEGVMHITSTGQEQGKEEYLCKMLRGESGMEWVSEVGGSSENVCTVQLIRADRASPLVAAWAQGA